MVQQTAEAQPTNFNELTFGQSLELILKGAGKAMWPAEVAKVLEKSGYQAKGKSPLMTLVSSELYRLASKDRILKTDSGYAIKPTH